MKKKQVTKDYLKTERIFKMVAKGSIGVFIVSALMFFSVLGMKFSSDMKKDANNPATQFKQTQEYATSISAEIDDVNQRYGMGEISLEQANNELETIKSDSHAKEHLLNSSNHELIALLKQQEKNNHDLNLAIILTSLPFFASFVGAVAGTYLAADAAEFAPYHKGDKNEENE